MPENGYKQNYKVPVFIYYDDRFIPVYREERCDGNPVAGIYVSVKERMPNVQYAQLLIKNDESA